LHEAAQREVFDDYLGRQYAASLAAIEAAAVPVPPLLAQSARAYLPGERPEMTLAEFGATMAPVPDYSGLTRLCLPADLGSLDPPLRTDCLALGARMAKSNAGVLARMIGVAIVRPLAPDTALAREVTESRRHYNYLNAMLATITPQQQQRYPLSKWFRDYVEHGEMTAISHQLEAAGIPGEPPADWQPADPNTLLSGRERIARMQAMLDDAQARVAHGDFAGAERLLQGWEAPVRDYATYDRVWMLSRLLILQGEARTGLGDYAAAEKSLQEAWKQVGPDGPGSLDTRACAAALFALYTAWQRAEPGQAHEQDVARWQRTRADLAGADGGRDVAR
jgi:hypothetical protein